MLTKYFLANFALIMMFVIMNVYAQDSAENGNNGEIHEFEDRVLLKDFPKKDDIWDKKEEKEKHHDKKDDNCCKKEEKEKHHHKDDDCDKKEEKGKYHHRKHGFGKDKKYW